MTQTYWIGKVFGDTLGHKTDWRYLFETLSSCERITGALTNFLAGFAAYDVVEIEIREVENGNKGKKRLEGQKKRAKICSPKRTRREKNSRKS